MGLVPVPCCQCQCVMLYCQSQYQCVSASVSVPEDLRSHVLQYSRGARLSSVRTWCHLTGASARGAKGQRGGSMAAERFTELSSSRRDKQCRAQINR